MYGEDETVQQLKDEEARAEKLVEMFERDVNNSPLYMMNQQLEYLIYSSTVDDYTKKEWYPTSNYNSPYEMTYEEYINAGEEYSVEDLALVFHTSYERSADDKLEERMQYASYWETYFENLGY